jgi:hypothetical protein
VRWGEVFPLLEAKQRLLPLRRVPIKALLRAELLVRKSVPDKTEKPLHISQRAFLCGAASQVILRGTVAPLAERDWRTLFEICDGSNSLQGISRMASQKRKR